MNLYGVKIVSDIEFALKLPLISETQYQLNLSSQVPAALKEAITCGFPFYATHGRKVYFYSDRLFDSYEMGQPYSYEVKNVVTFYWRSGEETIYYELCEQGDSNLLSFWFTHILLPLYLSLENLYDFLHAGCVDVDGATIMFIAPSMGGKSTMTDFFIRRGHGLISDDKVPTLFEEGQFLAGGSHPYHRPYRRSEELGYYVQNFIPQFKPIRAFYLLEAVGVEGDVTVTEVRGAGRFNILYPNYIYNFHFLQQKRLHYLAGILNTTHVFNITVPWDFARLEEVHDIICSHCRELG